MARGALPTAAKAWVLVGICVGAQLATLGFVGAAAALPRNASAWLSFPEGNGSAEVQFSPAPAWGGFYLTIQAVESPPCGGALGTCPVSYSFVNCLDPACQHLGQFVEAGDLEANRGTLILSARTSATAFLVTVYDGSHDPFTVRVGTSWSASGHGLSIVSGGSYLVLAFTGVAVAGLGLLAASLAVRVGRLRHRSPG